ncbi:DnaJ family domain-containing protein [Streptomyces sp. NPDC059166]
MDRQIREAEQRGAFTDLPGAGAPAGPRQAVRPDVVDQGEDGA